MWSALLSDTIPIAPAQYPHVLHEVFGVFVVGHTGDRVRQAKKSNHGKKSPTPCRRKVSLRPSP
jgi:hypothetical protein